MKLYDNKTYQEDIKTVANLDLPWDKLKNKSIVLSGATGMLGSFLIDVLQYKNETEGLSCSVFGLCRDSKKAVKRFGNRINENNIKILSCDVVMPLTGIPVSQIDYVLHLASNTHPLQYSEDPIGTITTNIIGLKNMLDYAVAANAERFLFTSSVEIYGENKGDTERFKEDYLGYIDCNTLRAGYPESKRAGEALCQAYLKQKKLDIVIPRLARTYGPSLLKTDTKAISQFIKNAVANEDIILKSEGTQMYSYVYVADAVSGLLTCLLLGKNGEAYNVSDSDSEISLRDLAALISGYVGKKVVCEAPEIIEAAGYSKATKAILDSSKLRGLGWKPNFNIKEGLAHTLDILKKTR